MAVADRGADKPQVDPLPATVAHELNNIVASMRGFLELSRDRAGGSSELLDNIGEIQLGVERVAALAADMAALAERPTAARAVALAECLPCGASAARNPLVVHWECDRSVQVLADATACRLALDVMARFGERDAASPPFTCHAEPRASRTFSCVHCHAACGPDSAWFTLTLPPDRVRLATPPDASRNCLSTFELRFMALARAAHAAGGHLALRSADQLSLVLPLA